MSKSGITQKYIVDTTQLHRRSHLMSHTYKEGPSGRAKGGSTKDAHKERILGPPASLLEEGAPGGAPPGVGWTKGSAKPGRAPVQVHLEEE